MIQKTAVIYNDKHILPYYYYLDDALFKLMQKVSGRVKYFGYTDQPTFLKKGDIDFSLCDTSESLHYWLRDYKPTHMICVGKGNSRWDGFKHYGAIMKLVQTDDEEVKHPGYFIKIVKEENVHDLYDNKPSVE